VPEAAKTPPPPVQPTDPQAWSKDLDLEAGPTKIDHRKLAEGLVAENVEATYSGQRLTYESALSDERPLTEAELSLKRARERAIAAGVVPPQVAAAPVEAVNQQALPPIGAPAAAVPGQRESRLPPPPKFPAIPATQTAPVATASVVRPEAEPAPPVPAETSTALLAAAEPTAAPGPGDTIQDASVLSAFVAEAWDAPAGTILVQVSAVEAPVKVTEEWQRLQGRYPQVLKPLRLVVEEAKLGDRGVFYRVQAGAFGSKADAAAACNALVSQGQACFVVVR
jgi:hypothetical protein